MKCGIIAYPSYGGKGGAECGDEEFSKKEACRLEHQISPVTIERIKQYTEFLDDTHAFRKYLVSKK